MTWKNSKSGTSEESPELPRKVRNFRRKSGTSGESPELPRKCPELPNIPEKLSRLITPFDLSLILHPSLDFKLLWSLLLPIVTHQRSKRGKVHKICELSTRITSFQFIF